VAQPKLTRPPKLVKFVQAPYPESERTAGKSATVVLAVVIGASGKVEQVTVTQSAGPAFDAAAVEAARAFVFEAAEVDGKPARIKILYRYQFVLKVELPKTATLKGVVRDRQSGKPVQGVKVDIDGIGVLETDAEGRFEKQDIVPGKRSLKLEGQGITPTQLEENLEAGKTTEVRYEVSLPAPAAAKGGGGGEDDLEIVVTAPPVRRQVVSTEVSAEQARRLPGTQGDVLRVVENLPGVARPAAGSGRLVVWGASPEDTRVYVDGVPIPRLYHDGGLRSVLQSEIVHSVDFTPGGYGAEYSRGLGGLVSVALKPLDDKGIHGAVVLDFYDVSASVRAALGERVNLAVGLRRSHLDSVLSVVDSKVGENFPIPHYYDGFARLKVELAPRRTIEANGIFSTDSVSRGKDSLDPLLVARETRGVNFFRGWLRYREELDGGSVLTVTPYAGADHSSLALNIGGTLAQVTNDTVLGGVRAAWRGRPERWFTLAVGIDADVRRASLARTGAIGLPPREGDIIVFGQPPPDTLSADKWDALIIGVAPWIEADFALAKDKLHIIPGFRVDPYARQVSRKTPAVGETPAIGLFANDFRAEPRLTLRFSPVPQVNLKAAAGLYHQQPAPEDLSPVFGNPALPVAEVAQYLFGAAFAATRTLSIETTAFFTMADQLPVRSPLPSPLLAQALVATGQGRAYGAQLLIRQELWHNIFGWISYTVSNAERRSDPTASWRPFDFNQTHLFTAVASYQLPKGFEVGARVRVASGYPRTAVVGASYDAQHDLYQPIFGPQNQLLIPFFFQLDARVAKRFKFRWSELELYLDVQNITNRSNVEELVYNHDYSLRGYITSLPVLAILGARWSF
jgi:TonB family protein